MKKLISAFVASVLSVSALSAVSATAVKTTSEDNLSVSTKVLDESIIIDDTIVSAGSVAITVNISDNSGFSSYSTKLELGSAYDIITDENNHPVVESGSVIGDSLVGSSCNDNVVVVSTASADENYENGNMFTIYAVKDMSSTDTDIDIYENETVIDSPVYLSANTEYYRVGDIDNDEMIMATDATAILVAIKKTNSTKLPYDSVQSAPALYFPEIAHIRAAFIWNKSNDKENAMKDITKETADEILEFYSCAATGQLYNGDSYLGQWRSCN